MNPQESQHLVSTCLLKSPLRVFSLLGQSEREFVSFFFRYLQTRLASAELYAQVGELFFPLIFLFQYGFSALVKGCGP